MPLREHLGALLHEGVAASDAALPSTLTGGPVHLRVRCTDAAAVPCLQARLSPTLLPAGSIAAEEMQDIRIVLDPGLAQRLSHTLTAMRPANEVGEPHRVLDGIHLVRKQAGARSERQSAYLLWSGDDPRTSCIVLSGSGAPSETLLLRLVRGVAARVLLAAGWVPLHSACVLTQAGAVCLLGAQGSGKTTALLHLLAGAAGQVALVANSIVLLSPKGPAEVRTLPTAIGLRAPSIRRFPVLDPLVSGAAEGHGKVYVPALGLAEAFGVSQSAGGPLTAFVHVAYRGSVRKSTWHPLTDYKKREAALFAAYLPDGLLDDPHEHARLDPDHVRWHHPRLRQCAAATTAAALEPGTDTSEALGSGLAELLAHAAR